MLQPFTYLLLAVIGQAIVGRVEKIETDQLQIKTQDGLVTLYIDGRTLVRKGDARNDVSGLAIGDEIRATCYGEEKLTAVNISARVTFSGVVTEASTAHIKVLPDPANDAGPPGKKTAVFVFLEPSNRAGAKMLAVGQRVQVTGWDSGDGIIDATQVTRH